MSIYTNILIDHRRYSYYCIFRFRILFPLHDCNLWYTFEKLFPCMELELSFLFLKSIYLRCCYLITWNKYLFSYLDRLSVNVNRFNWFSNVVMAKNSFYLYNGRSYPLQKKNIQPIEIKRLRRIKQRGIGLNCWSAELLHVFMRLHIVQNSKEVRGIYMRMCHKYKN